MSYILRVSFFVAQMLVCAARWPSLHREVTYGGDVLQAYLEKDARSLHARRQIKSPHMEVFFELLGYGAVTTGGRPLDLMFGDPHRLGTRCIGADSF